MSVVENPATLVASGLRLLVRPPRWLRLLALLVGSMGVATLFYLGSSPITGGLFSHPFDKVAHFVIYGGLAGLVWIVLGAQSQIGDTLAIVVAVVVGAADETMQRMIPTREASLGDLAADALGAIVVVVALCALRQASRQIRTSSNRKSTLEPNRSA